MLESLFNKITVRMPATLSKRLRRRCLPVKFEKYLRTDFFQVNEYNQFLEICFNFQVIKWLSVYIQFLERYNFSLYFFDWTKYPWKLEQGAEVVSCKRFAIGLQLLQKETPAHLFSCNFVNFLEYLLLLKLFFHSSFCSFENF